MYEKLPVGQERFKSDKRQLGGMIMLFATTALVFPMANLASLVGPDGTTASSGIPLTSLVASVFVITLGMIGLVTGYLQLAHDYQNVYLTTFFLLFNQLAWMPFITDMVATGRAARTGAAFFPPEYGASPTDVKFAGAMGILGILGYGIGFLGSLAFAGFALLAFQKNKPGDRGGAYFFGRMKFYCFAMFIVGISQLLLGAYIIARFGNGPLPYGPVAVATYIVNFPEISVTCGLLQVIIALYGWVRSFGIMISEHNHSFQALAFLGWLCTVSMQILVQVSYNPGDMAAAAAPSLTMLTLGIYAINAFLDFKMRTTPMQIPEDHYTEGMKGASKHSEEEVEEPAATVPLASAEP